MFTLLFNLRSIMALAYIASQRLWSNTNVAAPTLFLTGNGAHGVFTTVNTMASDPTNIDPTYLLPIVNPKGRADVCYVEFAGRIIATGSATAVSAGRVEIFGKPHCGDGVDDGIISFAGSHPLVQAVQPIAQVTPMQGDSLGLFVTTGGAPSAIMHGLAASHFAWPFINGATPANTRFHFLWPIGVMPSGDSIPHISGFSNLWVYMKTINGSAIAGAPSFVGAIWAHLYEEVVR